MANTVNNIYRNQYKKALRLRGAFEQYWLKYGIPSEGDSVKTVMGTIFNLLQDDLKTTTDDEDHNQAVYDMVEFQDLLKLIQQVLGKYLELSQEDVYQSTEPTVLKMKESILHEIKTFLEDKIGDEKAYENIKDEISKEVQKFVDKAKKQKKQELNGKQQESSSKSDDFGSEIVEKVRDFFSKKEQTTKKKTKTSTRSKEKGESPKRKDTLESKKPPVDGYGQLKVSQNKKDIAQKIQKSFDRSPIGLVRMKQASGTINGNGSILFKNKSSGVAGNSINSMKMAHVMSMSMFMEINKLDEKNSKKRMKQVEKGSKKVKSGIDKFGSAIMRFMLFPFKILSSIFSPVGKVLKGVVNTILHPIQTIKKLVSANGWFTNLFVKAMSNPGSAEFLGILIGGIAGSIYLSLQGVISKYSQPFMEVIGEITDFVNGIVEMTVDFFGKIKDFIRFAMFVLFTPRQNAGFAQRVLLNLATWHGSTIPIDWINGISKAFRVATILVGTMRNFSQKLNSFSPLLHGLLSGAGVLGIIPALAVSSGKILNELFEPHDGKGATYRGSNGGTEEDFQYGIDAIIDSTRDTLLDEFSNIIDDETRHNALLKTNGVLEKIREDVNQINQCYIMLDSFESSGISPDAETIKDVIESNTDILGNGYYRRLFKKIIHEYGKSSFDQLSDTDRIEVLRKVLNERLKSCKGFIDYFRDKRHTNINKAEKIDDFISGQTGEGFKIPEIKVETPSTQHNSFNANMFIIPSSFISNSESKQERNNNSAPNPHITGTQNTVQSSNVGRTENTKEGSSNGQSAISGVPSWFSAPLSQKYGDLLSGKQKEVPSTLAHDIEVKVGEAVLIDSDFSSNTELEIQGYAIGALENRRYKGMDEEKESLEQTIDSIIEEINNYQNMEEEVRNRLISDLKEARQMYRTFIIKVGNQGKGDLGGGG